MTHDLRIFPLEYRVCFKPDYQREFMKKVKNSIESQTRDVHWTSIAGKRLGKSFATIYDYFHENHRLGVKEVLLLLEFIPDSMTEVNSWVESIKSPHEIHAFVARILVEKYSKETRRIWTQKAGKAGGTKNLLKGREYFVKIGKLGKKATYRKYKDKTSEWGEKGGLKIAEIQNLTTQEKKIASLNNKHGLSFQTHYTLKNFNFDFVYFKNDKPTVFEEVTEEPPYKGYLFFKLVDLYERLNAIKQYNQNGILLFTIRSRKKTQRGVIVASCDILYMLLELGIIPVFVDIESSMVESRESIKGMTQVPYKNKLEKFKEHTKKFVFNELEKRKNRRKASSRRESERGFYQNEEKVHYILTSLGLAPKAKVRLEGKNCNFIVPDNMFKLNGQEYCVFVTSNTKNPYTLAKKCGTIAGYCFVIKKFFDSQMKCIAIVMDGKQNSKPIGKYFSYLKKYADIVTTETNLKTDLEKLFK